MLCILIDTGGISLPNRKRTKGERYRPRVTVKKLKNGKPTVIEIGGKRYVRLSENQFDGRKFNGRCSKNHSQPRK